MASTYVPHPSGFPLRHDNSLRCCRHVTDRLRSMRPGRPWNPLPSSRAARASRLERDAARLLNGPRSPSEAPSRAFVVSGHSGPPSRLITSQGRSAGLQRALSGCSRLACRLPRGYPPSSPASSAAVVPARSSWSSCRMTIWYQSGADQVVISHRGRAGGKTPPGRIWGFPALALGVRRGSPLD